MEAPRADYDGAMPWLSPLLLAQVAIPGAPPSSSYVVAVAEYRVGRRERALREIRLASPRAIEAGLQALREAGDAERIVVLPTGEKLSLPQTIDVATVEAAALMHAEAGLVGLQDLRPPRAAFNFGAATRLVEWLYAQRDKRARLLEKLNELAERKRQFDGLKRPQGPEEPDLARAEALKRALSMNVKIGRRPFYATVAAASLALGFPEFALPFGEKAAGAGPPDGETLLLQACVKESLAFHETARANDGKARDHRREAEALFRQALALSPDLAEARLRLGGVLLAEARPREAEPLLQQGVEEAQDPHHRYLALLFLARAAELQEQTEAGAGFYRRALETRPDSQASRLGLARCLELSGRPPLARELVGQSLLDSTKAGRERDPWWSYSFGPPGLAKTLADRLWQQVLGRAFGA